MINNISPYSIMILLSMLAGLAAMYLLNQYKGIDKITAGIDLITAMFLCPGCGLLLTLITSGFTKYGLSSLGGLAGIYLSVYITTLIAHKSYYRQTMTATCTVILPLMYSVAKIGCHLAGCCRGVLYNNIRFPVQLTETITFAVIFISGLILYIKNNKYTDDIIFITAIITKFMLDYLRESHENITISNTQILCLICLSIQIFFTTRKLLAPTYIISSNDLTNDFLKILNIDTLILNDKLDSLKIITNSNINILQQPISSLKRSEFQSIAVIYNKLSTNIIIAKLKNITTIYIKNNKSCT